MDMVLAATFRELCKKLSESPNTTLLDGGNFSFRLVSQKDTSIEFRVKTTSDKKAIEIAIAPLGKDGIIWNFSLDSPTLLAKYIESFISLFDLLAKDPIFIPQDVDTVISSINNLSSKYLNAPVSDKFKAQRNALGFTANYQTLGGKEMYIYMSLTIQDSLSEDNDAIANFYINVKHKNKVRNLKKKSKMQKDIQAWRQESKNMLNFIRKLVITRIHRHVNKSVSKAFNTDII